MDLRGLMPEDVYQLMSGGLNLRQLEGQEESNVMRNILGDRQLTAKQKQDAIENYYRMLKTGVDINAEQRLQRDQEFNQGKKDVTGTYTANGRVYRDIYDLQGNKVKTVDLGEAQQSRQDQKLLMTKEGKVIWAKPGDPIPDGATYVPQGQGQHPLSISDQGMLMSLQRIVEQGQDINGNEYDNEMDRDNAAAVVNASLPNAQYVKVPGVGTNWLGQANPPTYAKIPKSLQALKALPDTSVLGADEKTGQPVTLGQMKAVAQITGQPIEAVFKFFNIQYK